MSTIPEKFKLSIGGYTGRSYSITKQGDHLAYVTMDYGYKPVAEEIVTPMVEDWAQFFRAMDDIDIWTWKSDYDAQV